VSVTPLEAPRPGRADRARRSRPNPWIAHGAADREPRFSLICFPAGGGSGAFFRPWASGAVHAGLRVRPVQLPGRERRLGETPFRHLEPLVEALHLHLTDELSPPYALFGHSMGALVAFALARALARDGGPLPEVLVVAGFPAPDRFRPREEPTYLASDAKVVHRLQAFGGTPPAILENPELMALVLPTLRADFSVVETYLHRPATPLPVPVVAYGGRGDPSVSPRDLAAWRDHTARPFRARLFPGGHFFLEEDRAGFLATLREDLTPYVERESILP
jgi:medium-chain acyl-[acyl-carrier-protein] hydrolase